MDADEPQPENPESHQAHGLERGAQDPRGGEWHYPRRAQHSPPVLLPLGSTSGPPGQSWLRRTSPTADGS